MIRPLAAAVLLALSTAILPPATAGASQSSGSKVSYHRVGHEDAWLNHSGGIVYVIHPAGGALPTAPAQANW